jgi:hypothetical protein
MVTEQCLQRLLVVVLVLLLQLSLWALLSLTDHLKLLWWKRISTFLS